MSFVVFLPDGAHALDIFGLATSQVGFIDRGVNASAILVESQNLSAVGGDACETGIRVVAVVVESLKREPGCCWIEHMQEAARGLAVPRRTRRSSLIAGPERDNSSAAGGD